MRRDLHDRLPLVTDICADEAEVLALSVARFVAAGYMTADTACWDAAYDAAERALGPAEGLPFVAAVTGVMRAIRAERAADWSFMPATCCRVTPDERALVTLVALARRQRLSDVRTQAARLAGIGQAPRLAAAAVRAAEALERVEPLLATPAPTSAAARTPLH